MKKILVLACMVAAWATACAFVVNVSNLPAEMQGKKLQVVSQLSGEPVASVSVNGAKASLAGTLDNTTYCTLNYVRTVAGKERNVQLPLFVGNDTIDVEIVDFQNGQIACKGGELNAKFEEIMAKVKEMRRDEARRGEVTDFMVSAAARNANNPLGACLVGALASKIGPRTWLGLYHELSSKMMAYPQLVATSQRMRAEETAEPGEMFSDIKCVTPDGKEAHLSDFLGKGKYVLVDFWASWCGPCRREARDVILPLYEKYKDREDFMVLGVMTSDKLENHLAALQKIKHPWTQIIDADRLAGKTFGYKFIPQIMLVAPDGTILRRDLRGEEINKYVGEALSK